MALAASLTDIDWSQPWLAPWQDPGQTIAQQALRLDSVHQALNQAGSAPVQFVAQDALPAGAAYESHIAQTGCVPSRDNLHDFFNGLCWLQFPHTKRRLNALQMQQIAQAGIGPRRGPVRDAATVFDENVALLYVPDALWQALEQRQWVHLFGALRPLWQQAQCMVWGHALLEKLVHPYKSITAHVWRVAQPWHCLQALDTVLAQDLSPEKLASKPFVPLPILGVPGFWPANQTPGFYEDTSVFRPVAHRLKADAGVQR